ncbi:MAG: hypothetical protein U0559_09420 [Anaerolineae bacterium]
MRQDRIEQRFAPPYRLDGVHQIVAADLLEHIKPDAPAAIASAYASSSANDVSMMTLVSGACANFAAGFDAIATRQADVHDDHLGPVLQNLCTASLAVPASSTTLKLG